MDRRSRQTEPSSPVSSLANSTFFSVTGPSTPLANLSGPRPHHSDSPGQSSIPSPSGSSPFLVPRMPWDTMVDAGQEISTLHAQDRAMMADVSMSSGTRRPNTASDINFDHHVRGQSARGFDRRGSVDNTVLSHPSSASIVKDDVQGEGARLVRTLHLASEREVPRGQTISQLLSTMNGIVNLLRDDDNGCSFGFEQHKESSVSYAQEERLKRNEHDWQVEIQSVSARLEQTREEIIPLLKQVAQFMSVGREVQQADVATSAVPTSGVRPQESIEVLPSVAPSYDPSPSGSHERSPTTAVVASQPEPNDRSEKQELTEVLAQGDVKRNQSGDPTRLVAAQLDERLRAKEVTGKEAHDAATRYMLEQIVANQEVHVRNAISTFKDELMEQMRNNHLQALNSLEQQRIVSEGTIREITETWRADHEQQKMEIIEAVNASVNEQVPYNVQGYLDEFSRSLATEVRMLLSEVGKLREDKRNLEFQIGELLTFKSKYGPERQFDPSWKPSMTCVPAEAAPPPEPVPPPEPDVPHHAPSGWRTIHTRGSRRSRRTQAAPSPPPLESVPPPQSWATWQSSPVFQPSPLIPPVEDIEPPQGSSGLFGPGSPRDSVATENRVLLIEVDTLEGDMRNLELQTGEYLMLKAKSDLDDEPLSSQKPTTFRGPTFQPVSRSRSQGHPHSPSSSSRAHVCPSRIPRRVQTTRLRPPPLAEPAAPPVAAQSWTTWQPNPAFQPSPPIQPVEHLLGPPQGSPGLFGPRSPRDSVVR